MKKKYKLHVGTLQARGLYNLMPKNENDERCSLWFDREEYLKLKRLKGEEFNKACEEHLVAVPPNI